MTDREPQDLLEPLIAELPWRANRRPPQLQAHDPTPIARIAPWLTAVAASFLVLVGVHLSADHRQEPAVVLAEQASARSQPDDLPRYVLLVSADGRLRLYPVPEDTHPKSATP